MRRSAAISRRPLPKSLILDAALLSPPLIGHALLDRQLRFVKGNATFAALAGVPARELPRKRISTLLPAVPKRTLRAIDAVFDGAKHVAVMRLTTGAAPAQHWRISFWPQREDGKRITGIIAIATDETALRRARERVRRQRQFQDLLISMSLTFISLPADQVDGQIQDGLRRVAEFLKCDRAVLTQANSDGKLVATHSYAVPGFPPLPNVIIDEAFPSLARMIRGGKVVRLINALEQVPAEAVQERAWIEKMSVRAHLTIPIAVSGLPLCAITLSSKQKQHWPIEFISAACALLRATSFVNALGGKARR